MVQHSQDPGTDPRENPSRIDLPVAVRGASAGFSVLLIGGLLAWFLGRIFPAAAPLLGIAAAVVGFHVAARRIGTATFPALHGAVAAVMSYLLVFPIAWWMTGEWGPADTGRAMLNFALALSTGSLTGWMNSHKRI
jgi:hypothetical protein